MVRPGRDRLSGNVEVDETYVGGAEGRVGSEPHPVRLRHDRAGLHRPYRWLARLQPELSSGPAVSPQSRCLLLTAPW